MNHSYLWNCGKFLSLLLKTWHNGAAGQRQISKMASGIDQTRLNWNASICKGEVQVEMWKEDSEVLKTWKSLHTRRKILAINQYFMSPCPWSHSILASISFPLPPVKSLWGQPAQMSVPRKSSWALPPPPLSP